MFGLAAMLAIAMLITGSLNTISNEFMDDVVSKGLSNPSTFWSGQNEGGKVPTDLYSQFNHPFVQALFMMIGEASCMVVFIARNYSAGLRGQKWVNRHGWKATFCYAATATCDVTATSLMYAGLAMSSASVYQMLRGAIIIFTALISVFWLKRRLFGFQWFAIGAVIIGVTIVGMQSVLGSGPGADKTQEGLILGIILILAAQVIQAVQVTAQEKLITKFGTPGLRLVGLEGCFGTIILGVLLIPMYYIEIGGLPIENAPDAWEQIKNSPSELPTGHKDWHLPVGSALLAAILGNIVSIAFFNVSGIMITKVLSASHRMVLDSMRTCIVWAAALVLGWEKFHAVQLVGFVIMLFGTAVYNEYIYLPYFEYEQQTPPTLDAVEDNLKDSREVPLKMASDEILPMPRVNSQVRGGA